ncbi:MAG: glycosyltransferase [Bacteroidia bacterium]|nr:glycosyltransferase [Bacteroidia bacterium]
MKKAIVAVINDLATDQRVDRTCRTLVKEGFKVTLVGRRLPGSLPVGMRPYQTRRMRLLFRKGPLFYLFFNVRLFLFLLLRRADLIVANDLDTLAACSVAATLKRRVLWYDSHELFCEVPELMGSGWKKRVWERIERRYFPRLKFVSTVNESIALWYHNRYGIKPAVIRNIPDVRTPSERKSRADLGMPEDRKILLLQGAGINVDRGAEEIVEAMKHTEGIVLYIIGGGDVLRVLKQEAASVSGKVVFLPKMPFRELMQYTMNADAGLTLDKDHNLNYRYSLPNKLFDYIRCGIPVIASSLPEINRIFEQYNIGIRIPSHHPGEMAAAITAFLSDNAALMRARKEVERAAKDLVWEKEEVIITRMIKSMFP